jgi:hypothetical protein
LLALRRRIAWRSRLFSSGFRIELSLHGNKRYGSNTIRRQVEERDAMASIPPKANHKRKYFSPLVCCNHNAIDRMFCRLGTLGAVRPGYDRAP